MSSVKELDIRSLMPWRKRLGGELAPFGDFPFSLGQMREELDRAFDQMAREFSALTDAGRDGWRWGLDIEDEADKIVVRAEAPGFEAGDFDLRVEDSRLVLRASKKVETKDDKGEVKETRQQKCYESLALPADIDRNKVEARYINGVLTVALSKTAAGQGKRIEVKAG